MRADRRLCLQLRRRDPASDEHGCPRRDSHRPVLRGARHRGSDVGVGSRGGKPGENHGVRPGDPRRGRPVVGGEERDPVLSRRLVELVQRATLAASTPGSEELDPSHVERTVERDSRARTLAVGRADEDTVPQENAARPSVGPREEIAVDADDGGLTGDPALHRGERLAPNDGLVRQDRPQAVEADRPRAADDMDRDGTVRRELDSLLVGRSGKELSRLRRRGGGEESRRESGDGGGHEETEHGRPRVPKLKAGICRPYRFRTGLDD